MKHILQNKHILTILKHNTLLIQIDNSKEVFIWIYIIWYNLDSGLLKNISVLHFIIAYLLICSMWLDVFPANILVSAALRRIL